MYHCFSLLIRQILLDLLGAPGTVRRNAFEGICAFGGETVGRELLVQVETVSDVFEGIVKVPLGEPARSKEISSPSSSQREPTEVSEVELSEEDTKRSIIEVVAFVADEEEVPIILSE